MKKHFLHICKTEKHAKQIYRRLLETHISDTVDVRRLRIETPEEVILCVIEYQLDKCRGLELSGYEVHDNVYLSFEQQALLRAMIR